MENMKSIQLRQERANLVSAARTILDKADTEKRELNTEERVSWDKYNEDIEKLGRDAEAEERREHMAKLEDDLKSSSRKAAPSPLNSIHQKPDRKLYRNALKGWLKSSIGKPTTSEERSAAEQLNYNQFNNEITMVKSEQRREVESRALAEGTATGGAELFTYFNLGDYLDTALKFYGTFLNTSKVFETQNAYAFPLPTVNDTGSTAAVVSEAGSISLTDLVTGSVTFNSFKFVTGIAYSWELLEDALFPFESYVADQLAIRFARKLNTDYCVGNGSATLQGITVGSTASGVTITGSGAGASITADQMFDFIYSVDKAYRDSKSCGFVMHDSGQKLLRKLKDSNGQYLWVAGGGYSNALTGRAPDTFDGYPINVNNGMPQIGTATNRFMVFGDLSKYVVRKVAETRFQRLNELYALNGQIGLLAWSRWDGKVIDSGTHPLKYLINP